MNTKKIIWSFYIVFAFCFTLVISTAITENPYHKTAWLMLGVAAALFVFVKLFQFLGGNYKNQIEKNYKKILLCFGGAMFLLQLIFGITLRTDPLFDVGAIHHAAIEWVETGDFKSYHEYFYFFPNNLGSMTFLFVIFKAASIIGITDFYAVAVFVTSIMLSSSMLIVSLICRRLFDVRHAVFVLVLYALSVQFYFMGGAVYTDALSMLFPVLFFYLYLISYDKEGKDKLITYILMGLAAALGSLLKFTVVIMVIAVIIHMILNTKPKEVLKAAVCFIGVIAISTSLFNSFMYSTHLDKKIADENNTPYIHWVMMGLSADGMYNPNDYNLTRNTDHTIRDSVLKKEISKRIDNLGFSGMYDLLLSKAARNFGDGTYGIADCLSCDPLNETSLRDWLTHGSKNYPIYSHYATSIHIAILILMLAMSFSFIWNKGEQRNRLLPVYTAIFGIFLFLLAWESNRRYFSNFAPMIFIAGAGGIDNFINASKRVKNKLYQGIK